MAKTIVWVDSSPAWTEFYRAEILEKHPETKFVFHQAADLALKDLTVTPYDLIVLEPMLKPKTDSPSGLLDRILTECGEDLIEGIRKQEGPNRATPIVVIYPLLELWHNTYDGVNEVIDHARCPSDKFYAIIRRYLE